MRTFAHQSGRTYHLPLRLDEADRQQLQAVAGHHGKPTSLMAYLLLATALHHEYLRITDVQEPLGPYHGLRGGDQP
jgi:hypothetical protein